MDPQRASAHPGQFTYARHDARASVDHSALLKTTGAVARASERFSSACVFTASSTTVVNQQHAHVRGSTRHASWFFDGTPGRRSASAAGQRIENTIVLAGCELGCVCFFTRVRVSKVEEQGCAGKHKS